MVAMMVMVMAVMIFAFLSQRRHVGKLQHKAPAATNLDKLTWGVGLLSGMRQKWVLDRAAGVYSLAKKTKRRRTPLLGPTINKSGNPEHMPGEGLSPSIISILATSGKVCQSND